jgi:arylsulfatase A-like enzyme/Flp pilus assembly protein TadD
MTRVRVAAVAFALAVAAYALLALRAPRVGRDGPAAGGSVLLVTLDTLRADRLGAYGHTGGLTPHLDALARRGLVFEEGLASVPLTLPSHATLLSGLEPPRHGVHDNGVDVFPPEPETLATLLKARGYATAAFVGAYVLDRRFGLARGFDLYDDRIERGRDDGPSLLESERPCEAVVEAARGWIARQRGAFLAWVHLYDAHAPYAAPEAYRDRFPHPYDAEVAHLDSCIGSLLDATGPGTLTAVVGDHGEALGEHGEPTHGFFVYQSTLRIPYLLAGPGLPVGERRPGPARTADLLATLLARLGVAAPASQDGVDLLARGAVGEAYAESVYPASFGWAPLRSFRAGRLKLIQAPRAELYDLESDPGEARDLAAERPDAVRRLLAALQAFRGAERAASRGRLDPESAERLKALGYVAAELPAPPDAAGLRDPKDALAAFRAFEEASWSATRGEHARAVEALRPLLAAEPGNPVFRRSLAASLRRLGRGREAADVMSALSGGDAVAWHERAVAEARAGRVELAIESEKRAIGLNPRLPEPYNHLGLLEAGRGRHDAALRAFEAATLLDPNGAHGWNNRGNALRALGRADEARQAYLRAAALAPRDADPLNGLGVLLVQARRPEEAAQAFRQALALDPDLGEARLNLAVAEAQLGRVESARAELQRLRAQRIEPGLRRRAEALAGELERP